MVSAERSAACPRVRTWLACPHADGTICVSLWTRAPATPRSHQWQQVCWTRCAPPMAAISVLSRHGTPPAGLRWRSRCASGVSIRRRRTRRPRRCSPPGSRRRSTVGSSLTNWPGWPASHGTSVAPSAGAVGDGPRRSIARGSSRAVGATGYPRRSPSAIPAGNRSSWWRPLLSPRRTGKSWSCAASAHAHGAKSRTSFDAGGAWASMNRAA